MIEEFPAHAIAIRANRLLAWTYAQQGNDAMAIETEERMLDTYATHGNPNDLADAYLNKAHILFNRKEYEKRGVNTSQISTRIVNCWRQVAQLQLEVQKHGVVVIDPNSEEMQRIFKMWVEILQRVTAEMVTEGTLSTESLDLFFSKFSKAMEGWEGRLG